MSKIFISYSHQDETWKNRLVTQLKVLEMEAHCEVWHDREIRAGDDWLPGIETALAEADVAVLLVTADFLTSQFITEEEIPTLLKRREEDRLRVIPVIVKPSPWKRVKWLSPIQARPKDGKALSGFDEHGADTELANLAEEIYDLIEEEDKGNKNNKKKRIPETETLSLTRLPVTGAALFGREDVLKRLDEAWHNENTHVVTLIAFGGVGKTALVNVWLNKMEQDRFRGAQRVYGWSFYSQGAAEGSQAAADLFLEETLQWFGDPEPKNGTTHAKGKRLARLIRKQPTLLILDGLEPLQYPPGDPGGLGGQIKDKGVQVLVKELASSQPGLCLISSRETVSDLKGKEGFSLERVDLERLSNDAGVALLKSLGVATGSPKDMTEAVTQYGGHALALTLLGNFIATVHQGDIRKRDLIGDLRQDEEQGGHARRVMASYQEWLGTGAERDILYMMGLFDRPAPTGAIAALKEEPAIEGVTETLGALPHHKWEYALKRLRTLGLLAKENRDRDKNNNQPDSLDCHPLVREHFAERLKQEHPTGWKAAHQRLYGYYKNLPKKELPDSLQEMEPLFSAVAHGCLAGLHQEA
ncbi:MAG: toll/interleukin-1 receptor domain-containing protein, partial [bacterium]|nr:toll/interleukin-1 receptor domain-containing protein [bacterium]